MCVRALRRQALGFEQSPLSLVPFVVPLLLIDPGRFASAWVYWGGSFSFVYNNNFGVSSTSLGFFPS